MIDVKIPADRNVMQKEAEKKLKYRILCIEIQLRLIPVINGATGIATKGLKKHLEAIPGKHSVGSLLLVTSHILFYVMRKVLQSET